MNLNELKKVIILTASYYRVALSPEVLEMYVTDLEDLPATQAIQAYLTYRRDPKNRSMPIPAQIRSIAEPSPDPQDIAILTSGKVTQAVSKYGWSNSAAAMNYIGPLGRKAVSVFGGWAHVCENLGTTIGLTTFQAQVRELIKSEIRVSETGQNHFLIDRSCDDKPEQIDSKIAEVIRLGLRTQL